MKPLTDEQILALLAESRDSAAAQGVANVQLHFARAVLAAAAPEPVTDAQLWQAVLTVLVPPYIAIPGFYEYHLAVGRAILAVTHDAP